MRSWIPYLGAALEFSRTGSAYLRRMRPKYGEVFTTLFAGHRTTFLADCRDIPLIYRLKDAFDFTPVSQQFGGAAFDMDPEVLARPDGHVIHRQHTKFLMGEGLRELTDKFWDEMVPILNRHPMGEWQQTELMDFVRGTLLEASVRAMGGSSAWYSQFDKDFVVFDKLFPTFLSGLPQWLFPAGRKALHTLSSMCGRWGEGVFGWILACQRGIFV